MAARGGRTQVRLYPYIVLRLCLHCVLPLTTQVTLALLFLLVFVLDNYEHPATAEVKIKNCTSHVSSPLHVILRQSDK